MVAIAQLVEHLVVVQEVAGSSPVSHPYAPASPRSFSERPGFCRFRTLCQVPMWCRSRRATISLGHSSIVLTADADTSLPCLARRIVEATAAPVLEAARQAHRGRGGHRPGAPRRTRPDRDHDADCVRLGDLVAGRGAAQRFRRVGVGLVADDRVRTTAGENDTVVARPLGVAVVLLLCVTACTRSLGRQPPARTVIRPIEGTRTG